MIMAGMGTGLAPWRAVTQDEGGACAHRLNVGKAEREREMLQFLLAVTEGSSGATIELTSTWC